MKVPKTYLDKFSIITEECTAVVQSMQTITERMLIDDAHPRYLVPLRAIDDNNLEAIVELLSDDDDDYIDIELLYPFLLTGVIWQDKITHKLDLPVKGENVVATFSYGSLDELVCEGIVTLGKVKPIKFKLNELKK